MPIALAQGLASNGAQGAGYTPTITFDVASVRESPAADSYFVGGWFQPHSSSLRLTNNNIQNLLASAYGVRWDQLSGVPAWREMFNIEAKADSAADERLAHLSKSQERLEQHMLQGLLADRFKLKVHWEDREGPAFDLVVGKKGPKMREAVGAPPSPAETKAWGEHGLPPIHQEGDSRVGFDFIARGCSMDDLAREMADQFGRPVLDKTGLIGKYDFKLRYHDIFLKDRAADDLDPVAPLDVAIQDQLGLKLVLAKGIMRVLVIDHLEKPSEN
jgi:uncharacterized protein (TIGR03435 family)